MIALFSSALLQVLLVSLVVGAGVPALFSLGIRAMAWGVGGDADVGRSTPHPLGRVLGVILFALVVALVLTGVAVVIASGLGMAVSFEHVFPTFTPKH